MLRSRTMTAPTCLRSQVLRVATWCPIAMKYSSQLARLMGRELPNPGAGRNAPRSDLHGHGVDHGRGGPAPAEEALHGAPCLVLDDLDALRAAEGAVEEGLELVEHVVGIA